MRYVLRNVTVKNAISTIFDSASPVRLFAIYSDYKIPTPFKYNAPFPENNYVRFYLTLI